MLRHIGSVLTVFWISVVHLGFKKGVTTLYQEYTDYLAHYGIKGQKWGVRRFQNEDGSLTSDGKKRLTLYQQMTHGKKEHIRNKALAENKERQYVQEQYHKDWDKEAKRIQKMKKEYDAEDSYKMDLHFAKRQAEIGKKRVEAWKRREKWLMNMNVDELSVHRIKKSTKLKWHELYLPTEFENN